MESSEKRKLWWNNWYTNNKEKRSSYGKEYRAKNKEKLAAYFSSPEVKARRASQKGRMAIYRENNKEKIKSKRLLKNYGLTLVQMEEMIKAQGDKCFICLLVKPLVVDHNHKTGKVRNLLCKECNAGIGLLKDSEEILTNALNYIKTHNLNTI